MIKRFYDPVFSATVILATGKWENIKVRGFVFLQEDGKTTSGGVSIIDKEKDGQVWKEYLVHVEDKGDFYTLSHEVVHLVRWIFTDRGILFDNTNDETIAYYHTYWLKKLWRAMSKPTKKD